MSHIKAPVHLIHLGDQPCPPSREDPHILLCPHHICACSSWASCRDRETRSGGTSDGVSWLPLELSLPPVHRSGHGAVQASHGHVGCELLQSVVTVDSQALHHAFLPHDRAEACVGFRKTWGAMGRHRLSTPYPSWALPTLPSVSSSCPRARTHVLGLRHAGVVPAPHTSPPCLGGSWVPCGAQMLPHHPQAGWGTQGASACGEARDPSCVHVLIPGVSAGPGTWLGMQSAPNTLPACCCPGQGWLCLMEMSERDRDSKQRDRDRQAQK